MDDGHFAIRYIPFDSKLTDEQKDKILELIHTRDENNINLAATLLEGLGINSDHLKVLKWIQSIDTDDYHCVTMDDYKVWGIDFLSEPQQIQLREYVIDLNESNYGLIITGSDWNDVQIYGKPELFDIHIKRKIYHGWEH